MQEVSQLMDGEFEAVEAVREVNRIKSDSARREAWDTYHLIGEALRATAREPVHVMRPGFQERLSQKLAAEPTVLAPRSRRESKTRLQSWAMPIAASVAAVAVVGGMTFSALKPDSANLITAKAPQPVLAVAETPLQAVGPAVPAATGLASAEVQVREHMHEYLLAHQGISPSTAIQGVTPYVRTVSVTGD